MTDTVLELSSWQFILTSMAHFLFMPLTLGLALLLVIMESAYVLTGQASYKLSCQFWGRLFAINFVLAFASRLLLFFQFGMINSYLAFYIGDVFALPLAIETITTGFLVALLFGPYLSGWETLGKWQHLAISWLMAITVTLSVFWACMAYGWLQNPVAAVFNDQSFRVELGDVSQLFNNPLLLSKFLHSLSAAYVCCAAAMLAISAWLLRQNPTDQLAHNNFKLAAVFGLVFSLLLAVGDNTPQQDNPVQISKQAILNGTNTASLLPDIEARIRNGIKAYNLLQTLRDENKDPQLLADFNLQKSNLGYALLLERLTPHIMQATDKQIALAAQTALPAHPSLLRGSYWLMIALGVLSVLVFAVSAWIGFAKQPAAPLLLKLTVYLFPLSWLASAAGWYVAEAGKQPWAVAGILPSFMSVSSLSVTELVINSVVILTIVAAFVALGWFLLKNLLHNYLALVAEGSGS
jgi:cytochrome d ubiquinol oxidase subunit I